MTEHVYTERVVLHLLNNLAECLANGKTWRYDPPDGYVLDHDGDGGMEWVALLDYPNRRPE